MNMKFIPFKNHVKQTINIGDRVILVRHDGNVQEGIYIGCSQSYSRSPLVPHVLVDDPSNKVQVWVADKSPQGRSLETQDRKSVV